MDRFDLGAYRRLISTRSAETQRWFDVGLNWCYGFNHEEGIKCFEKALEFDPRCAMAHWGIAYAAGPFYNLTWKEHGDAEADSATRRCFEHVQLARVNASDASPVERRLIEALAHRFQKPHRVTPREFEQWDDAYAAAMRAVYESFPDDHDVMALFVEALMMRTVRRLWDLKTGEPAPNSDVVEALQVCERSIRLSDEAGVAQHPAILHLHIHLLEMSDMPERGMRSADLLGTLCPDAGHMNHMPGHIYVLCGDYQKAVLASEKAITADNVYADYAGSFNFYVTARCHDLHLMMFTCMFLGQYKGALEAANTIRRILPREILAIQGRPKIAYMTEAYYAMKMHVLVRFGRWQDILDEPMVGEPELYVLTAAMQ